MMANAAQQSKENVFEEIVLEKSEGEVVMLELVPNLICDLLVNSKQEETELGPSAADDNDFSSSPTTSDSEQCQSLDSDKLLDDDDDEEQTQREEIENVPKIEENNLFPELNTKEKEENELLLQIAAVISSLKKQVSRIFF